MITGAAGFIGSCLTGYLNRKGYQNIIIVDDFEEDSRRHNYDEKKICARVDKDELFDWLDRYKIRIDFVFHIGTFTGSDAEQLHQLNMIYSQNLWNYCIVKNIPFVYVSSADSYVSGELGFKEDHELPGKLNSSTTAAAAKNEFDKWALQQEKQPSFWAGLKLFAIYGPNEYHKGGNASLIFQAFHQAKTTGKINVDRLGTGDISSQDFVYVKDVVDICYWFMQKSAEKNSPVSGLYNIGTGKARSLQDVANAVSRYVEKPAVVKESNAAEKHTLIGQADISKLRQAGYSRDFYSLEEGVKTYLQHFLNEGKYY